MSEVEPDEYSTTLENGITWSFDHRRGHKRYEAHLAPYGILAAIIPDDATRSVDEDGNALTFVKKPGESELSLFLAQIPAEEAARLVTLFIQKRYMS